MAKKKTTSQKSASGARGPKGQKKVTGKAASPEKASGKKMGKSKTAGSRGSIDDILKKYEKVRAEQQQQLSALQKSIDDLESKSRVLQQQIVKLRAQESSTKNAISQLDSRRDAEVATLLSKLGVQWSGSAAGRERPDRDDNTVSTSGNEESADDENGNVEPSADTEEEKSE